MNNVAIAVLILSLSLIAFEDIKGKSFRIIWLILLTLSTIYLQFNFYTLSQLAFNIGFMLLNIIGVSLFFSIKERKLVNIAKGKLGLGDILYFIPLCLMFPTMNLIAFFFISIILALLAGIFMIAIKKGGIAKIPLAGVFSMNILVILLLNNLEAAKFFEETKISSIIETLMLQ